MAEGHSFWEKQDFDDCLTLEHEVLVTESLTFKGLEVSLLMYTNLNQSEWVSFRVNTQLKLKQWKNKHIRRIQTKNKKKTL